MKTLVFFLMTLLLFFPACFLTTGSNGDSEPKINPDYLEQHWQHSREEEPVENKESIYRPDDYKEFPPSRFRIHYIFEKDGSCKWYYLAPNDAHHFKDCTWRLDGDLKDILHINKGDNGSSEFRIVELEEDILRIAPIEAE